MKTRNRRPARAKRHAIWIGEATYVLARIHRARTGTDRAKPLPVYRRLRCVGKVWKRIKKLLTRLGLNIDEWAHKHLSITSQWADKHAELDSKWPEFTEALEWAEKIGWESDRDPQSRKQSI